MVGPTGVEIRAYNVGFGDCFLVTFEYGTKGKRCILIDCGSTGKAKGAPGKLMEDIAADISDFVAQEGGGVLYGVVATHRHKDHISGFGSKSGAIIERLKPKIVVQPWTEDPKAQRAARSATSKAAKRRAGPVEPQTLSAMQNQYLQSFSDMTAFSASGRTLAENPRLGKVASSKIHFIADDNIPTLTPCNAWPEWARRVQQSMCVLAARPLSKSNFRA
jgi:hypothetical protein